MNIVKQFSFSIKQNDFTEVHIIVFHNKAVLLPYFCVIVGSSFGDCLKMP